MRTLYIVPIIHIIEDYGSLASAFQDVYIRLLGQKKFDEKQKQIREFWILAEKEMRKHVKKIKGLIIYQDAFPATDRKKIQKFFDLSVNDNPKSPNFLLIKKLLTDGAILEGTEDFNLIVEQMELAKQLILAPSEEERKAILEKTKDRSAEIVRLRDAFIAKRIWETLPSEGEGIIFIGRDHDVIKALEELEAEGEEINIICL